MTETAQTSAPSLRSSGAAPVVNDRYPALLKGVRTTMNRYLAVDAGPFALALPLSAVRQILDMGGSQQGAALDPKVLGVVPVSLAALLHATPSSSRPALLLLDNESGATLLSVCALHGVFDGDTPVALPSTVACRWPALLSGVVHAGGVRLAIDPRVLVVLHEGEK